MDNPADFKPPYMSFQTFWNFIADLAAKPLPRKLDRSIMQSKSGTDQNNLMTALEGFGFIDGDGVVQPSLEQFQEATPEQRKKILAALLNAFYGPPIRVSANNGTPNDLTESFRDQLGMTAPDTRRKAITFFLHAAREAEINLSPHFPKTRAGSGAPGTPKNKRTGGRRQSGSPGGAPQPRVPPTESGHSHTITLRSGGTVTLSYNVNMFEVDDTDEKFVLALIKKLRDYRPVEPAKTDAEGTVTS